MELRALIYVEGEWNPSLFCQETKDRLPIYQIPTTAGKMAACERIPKPPAFNRSMIAADTAGEQEEAAAQQEKKQYGESIGQELQHNMLHTLRKWSMRTREVLLIAATDQTVQAAKQLGIAVAGYVNPLFPGQTFAGVPMVVEGFEEVDREFLERIYKRFHGLPWTIAVTERCVIREMTLGDLDDLIRLYEQPGITWRLDEKGNRIPGFIEPLYPREEEKAYQEAYISNMYGYYGYGMWAVTDRESGKLIGRAGLDHREYGSDVELEMGYLIDPKYQHRGMATEVCQAILDFARDNLDFSRINALTDPQNLVSEVLLKRLGFVYLEDFPVAGNPMRRYTFNF